jgi:hypothetical protein
MQTTDASLDDFAARIKAMPREARLAWLQEMTAYWQHARRQGPNPDHPGWRWVDQATRIVERARSAPKRAPRMTGRAAPARCSSRPREQQSRAHSRRGPPGDDDPSIDPPAGSPQSDRADVTCSGDSDLNVVWRDAMARFETVDEYLALADLALRRTEWLIEIGWGRAA